MFGRKHHVKEVIGWDPESKSIRGWMFAANGVATGKYSRDGTTWKVEATLVRNDSTESEKNKKLSIDGDKMTVINEVAPLAEFLMLEFKRQVDDE